VKREGPVFIINPDPLADLVAVSEWLHPIPFRTRP
jgi:hypothetical protein